MRIDDNSKTIFLHNVKCGGRYIKQILNLYKFNSFNSSILDKHKNYDSFYDKDYIINLDNDYDSHTIKKQGVYRYYYSHQDVSYEIMDKYFIFSFVRNPYEKIYSAYNYLKQSMEYNYIDKGNKYYVRNTPENYEYFKDFKTFIENYNNVCTISYFHAFITQYDMLVNYSNKINFSYIGRLETINEDLTKILTIQNYNLDIFYKYKKIKNDYSDITEYYDEEIFNFVNSYFEIDFETFGYKKYNSFKEFKNNFFKEKKNIINENNKKLNNYNLFNEINLYYKNIEKYNNLILLKKNEENEENSLQIIDNDINIFFNDNNKIIDKIKNILKLEKEILKGNYNICEKCNYKTYNYLSFFCHNKTCK